MRPNTLIATLVLGSGILAGGTLLSPALAQPKPASDDVQRAHGKVPSLTLHEVQRKLDAMGYRELTKISRGRYAIKARATDSQGRRVDIEVDPATGNVVDTEIRRARPNGMQADPAPWLTLHQVQVKLEAMGYRDIEKIDRERNGYEANATNSQGRRVKLAVAPRTGDVVEGRELGRSGD